MRFATYEQERFEKLPRNIQLFLMNDFQAIRCVDIGNDSKIHYFKRENGKLFYLQTIENKAITRTRSDGRKFHRYASESIYTRSDINTYGWTNASDDDGVLNHGHACQLMFHMEKVQTVGDRVRVYRNQATRTGQVLATDTNSKKSLVEYKMPNGAVYMNVIDWRGEPDEFVNTHIYIKDARGHVVAKPYSQQVAPQTYKTVSMKGLSKRWLGLLWAQDPANA
mgnify:FL=1|tara:strand:- start:471 stop:1139 length:669 start_codon:yes stop_codon:yes gene_type:complete